MSVNSGEQSQLPARGAFATNEKSRYWRQKEEQFAAQQELPSADPRDWDIETIHQELVAKVTTSALSYVCVASGRARIKVHVCVCIYL